MPSAWFAVKGFGGLGPRPSRQCAVEGRPSLAAPVSPRPLSLPMVAAAPVPTRPPWRSARSPAKLLGSFFLSAVAARLGRDLQLNFDNSSVVHVSLLALLGALGAYLAHSFGSSRTSFWLTLMAGSVGAAVGASLDEEADQQHSPLRTALEGFFVGLADMVAAPPVRKPLLGMAATVGDVLPGWTLALTAAAASVAATAASHRAPTGETVGPLGVPKHGWCRCCGLALAQAIALGTVLFVALQHVPAGERVPSCARSPGTRVGDVFAGCGFGPRAFEHWGAQSSFEWRWDFQQASSTSSWMSRWHNAAHYRVLGLQPGATQSEIRTAFLKRSIETHPDKNPGQQAAFVKVRDAYDALKA